MMRKVLIVDDEEAVRKLVMASLLKCGFQLIEAENGGQAVALAASCRPDLVIMDLSMPGSPIDGLEAIQRIREFAETGCQILVVSGALADWDNARASNAGAQGFLAKPFSPLTLRERVVSLLAERPSAGPVRSTN